MFVQVSRSGWNQHDYVGRLGAWIYTPSITPALVQAFITNACKCTYIFPYTASKKTKSLYMMIAVQLLSCILPISCGKLFGVSLGLNNPGSSCMPLIKTGTKSVGSSTETLALYYCEGVSAAVRLFSATSTD